MRSNYPPAIPPTPAWANGPPFAHPTVRSARAAVHNSYGGQFIAHAGKTGYHRISFVPTACEYALADFFVPPLPIPYSPNSLHGFARTRAGDFTDGRRIEFFRFAGEFLPRK